MRKLRNVVMILAVVAACGGDGFTPDPLYINTATMPSGVVGEPYQGWVSAIGGEGLFYTWAIVEGALPAGLSMSVDGVFTGTPTVAGTTRFWVEVTTTEGDIQSVRKQLSITIRSP